MIKAYLFIICMVFQTMLIGQDYLFYALSNSPTQEKPLYLCSLNATIGNISIIERYSGPYKGDYLALSADHKHLLTTCKNAQNTESGIMQFDVMNDGMLSYVAEQLKSTSDQPCHVSFTPDMQYVLSANYGDNEISLYNFNNQKISSETDVITMPDQSKGHFICTDNTGKFVHAVFLGLNKVYSYTISNSKFVANTNQEYFELNENYGPRHLVFHPSNQFVYILNETHSSVTVCRYNENTGTLTKLQNIRMLPSGFTDENYGAAIRVHPGGEFLYASNRGHNSIAVYKIANDGTLNLVEHELSGINYPRDFNISPDGKFMVIGNQKGSTLKSYKINETTGELDDTGMSLIMNSPVSIQFLPLQNEDSISSTSLKSALNTPINIYPNPAKETLNIYSNTNLLITNVAIFNSIGKQVLNMEGVSINKIDVSHLTLGTYIITTTTTNGTQTNKFIIQ